MTITDPLTLGQRGPVRRSSNAASAAVLIMPTARAVSSVPASRLAIPTRCSA
jgi:hypothetical protein